MLHSESLRATHRLLSPLCEKMIDQCIAHPESITRFDPSGLPGENAKYTYNPWPYFGDNAFRAKIVEATETVMGLFPLIPERVFGDDMEALAEMFGYESAEIAADLVRKPNGLDQAMARPDFLLTDSGFKCLETNVSPNLGGILTERLSQLYLEQPFVQGFVKEHQISTHFFDPIKSYLAHLKTLTEGIREGNCMRYAMLIGPGPDPAITFHKMPDKSNAVFHKMYKEMGYELHPIGFLAMPYPDGIQVLNGEAFVGENRIHAFASENPYSPELMEVYRNGKVALINTPGSLMLTDKRCLALLSTYADSGKFSAEESAAIHQFIPWSRLLQPSAVDYRGESVDLEPLVRNNKDDFVIKRGQGLAGVHVHVGKDLDESAWQTAIDEALEDGTWIVQEALSSIPFLAMGPDREISPHQLVWGFFTYGGRYGGSVLRAQKIQTGKNKINAHSGAMVATLLFT